MANTLWTRRVGPVAFGVMETVVVGARGSRLAQAMVAEFLARLGGPCPVVNFRNRVVMTDGDRDRRSSLREVSGASGTGSGAFSNQLGQELLEGRIDVAVHSLKDLPTAMPEGLVLAVTPPREDVHDALCGSTLAGLRRGARVGTGSPRRAAQLKALRPDLTIIPIRGNVPPRLAKLKTGMDAVVLAAAGLRRLGLADSITELLPLDDFPPSPGQGAMGIQLRAADSELWEMLNSYGDPAADAAVLAERALLAELHGGCSVPVGAYAMHSGDGLKLTAQVTSLDGSQRVFSFATGTDAKRLGETLARTMLEQGAEAILRQIRVTV
ncbi:MAG: hydroxymethylbilane synthase [Pseudonocardiaceae bacterium]